MAKTKTEIQREYEKRTNYAAQTKYIKEKTKRYVFNCVFNTEQDMIDFLDGKENKAGYIKELIRKDMQENNRRW